MATTTNWDSDTSTGAKGVSRIFTKRNGTWDRIHDLRAKVNGSWKQVRKAWVKENGTWRPQMWHPELNYDMYLGQPYVYSRSGHHGWAQVWIRWTGGDLFVNSNWQHKVVMHQVDGNFWTSSNGWQNGIGGFYSANQTRGQLVQASPTLYDDGTSIASSFGACTPVWHMMGSHYGSEWSNRRCYDNPDLNLTPFGSSSTFSGGNPWGSYLTL